MTAPRRRPRLLPLLALVAALSLVAAACGDDEAADTTATTEATEDTMAEDTMAEDDMAQDEMAQDEMAQDEMAEEPMAGGTPGEAAAPTGPACGAVPADGEGSFTGMADDPAATAASNNPVLSTLVAAVGEAGLVDTLNGPGPFTIFAPTNDAFAAIPADQLDAVLADTELLTSILTYHVVAGEQLSSAELADAGTVETVNGAALEVGDGTVGGAQVVCADVSTANATVHLIDQVLMP